MKKKIIALLMSTVSVAAFADVNLYGKVAVGAENDEFPNSTVPGTGSVQDFGSYFGIRGSDPVYGQTSAIWQLEQYLDLTTGQAYYASTAGGTIVKNSPATSGRVIAEANVLGSSESYLGLQGAWGRLKLGNLSNYMRSNMSAVDMYNYGNGVDGLGVWSRSSRLLPEAARYDSPSWNGFTFGAMYSYDNSGQTGISGIGSPSANFNSGLNGYYSGGIYSAGLQWAENNFSATLGTTVWENVGTYTNGTDGMAYPAGYPSTVQYYNAYVDRLELSYNDPDAGFIGLGVQIANGLGWWSWANSGGSFTNYYANPGFNYVGLDNNQYQTEEFGLSMGWHFGPWTPKIGYVYGTNMMYNGSMTDVLTGSANQIPDSGYQQAVAELDWNINPRTIVFLNAGEIWWGNTMQNISYCGSPGCGSQAQAINGSNQAFTNQASTAIGFSHTF